VIDAAPDRQRERLDTLAGLMSATAIFLGLLGMTNLNLSISGTHLEMRPIRIGVAAVALALVSAAIGGRHRRLAAIAVGVAGACWALGMVIAVVTRRPVF
jgi:site-specific recombinase